MLRRNEGWVRSATKTRPQWMSGAGCPARRAGTCSTCPRTCSTGGSWSTTRSEGACQAVDVGWTPGTHSGNPSRPGARPAPPGDPRGSSPVWWVEPWVPSTETPTEEGRQGGRPVLRVGAYRERRVRTDTLHLPPHQFSHLGCTYVTENRPLPRTPSENCNVSDKGVVVYRCLHGPSEEHSLFTTFWSSPRGRVRPPR